VSLPYVLVNGSPDTPAVSVRDRGFTLADGLFETMRVQNGAVFRLDHHLLRLAGGLAMLGIPASPHIREWILDAVARAGVASASVRLTVTRGPAAGGLLPPAEVTPTVVVTISQMPEVAAATYERGLTSRFAAGRRNEHSASAGVKTLAYTDNVLEYLAARRAGVDEAIFLDTAGHCSEATASNLFIWTGDDLVTPPVSCAALPGVTRRLVQELAATGGITWAERPIEPHELLAAQEAFLTSSLRGVAPLVSLQDQPLGSGRPGPLTRQLMEAHAAAIARECGG
jgi:branched-chain amino acid aminotransferase